MCSLRRAFAQEREVTSEGKFSVAMSIGDCICRADVSGSGVSDPTARQMENAENEMQVYAADGLDNIRLIPSPNFDERPSECDISLLVIHNISLPPDEFSGDGVIQFFMNSLESKTPPFLSATSRPQGFSSLLHSP